MAYITGISIRGGIHTDFSTGISGWNTQRTALTGEFTRQAGNVSGRYGEFSKDIQEYNRKIDTLSGAWNDTGMFLTPYNAGFRYTGTGDFNKWDTYSLAFDGVDDYLLTNWKPDFVDTNATMSCWVNMDAFPAGGNYVGLMGCDKGSNRFYMGFYDEEPKAFFGVATSYRFHVDISSYVSVGSWHHICLVADDATATYYVDGVARDTVGYPQDPAYNPSTELSIGGVNAGSPNVRWFTEGNIDEVAIFNYALSAAQILAIYNGGTPQSLAPYSPTSWWRMGDGTLDDGDERLIGDQMNLTFGSELLTNGDFSDASVPDTWNGSAPVNLVGWTSGGSAYTAAAHFVITDGNCRLISDGTNIILNGGTCVVGKTYEYSLEVTDVTAGGLTPIGGGVVLEANITSVGTYAGVFTAAATTAMAINRNAGTTDITFGNVSVKEFNGYVGRMKNMTASDIVADTP